MMFWFSLPSVSIEVGETIKSLKKYEDVSGSGNKINIM